jgi:hypothetical protein
VVTLGVAAEVEVEVEAAVATGGPAAGGECGVVGNWYVVWTNPLLFIPKSK